MNTRARALAITVAALIVSCVIACGGDASPHESKGTDTPKALPSPVEVRQEPEGITLGDPSFTPMPGARADYGRLGGSVYQIEMPDKWNGRLVLYMHGYGELAPEARASAPGLRAYLILHGYAWGASSFSSTSSIPGRAADETAALWDFFAKKYGRPAYTYVTGQSMGGAASHIAASRYGNRFDGALALCGAVGQTEGVKQQANFFAAAAYVAGVTQAEFDATTDVNRLIQERIMPDLQDSGAHTRWEDIMIDISGGPRAFDRQGFHFEEATNWVRATLAVTSHIAPNAGTVYKLGPTSDVSSADFNRDVIRLPINDELMHAFADGQDMSGDLQMPVISLHTTGDGQVWINQAQLLQHLVDKAGKSDLLVQRIYRDPGHCGFTNEEWEANFQALVAWVEQRKKPGGENVLVDDLTKLGGKFELSPREGSEEAAVAPGARDRATVTGELTLDGEPLNSRFLGAVVVREGLVTPCQASLPQVDGGHYEINVLAETEGAGCGAKGGKIYLWTNTQDTTMYTSEPVAWPGNGKTVEFNGTFSLSEPLGGTREVTEFFGETFDKNGDSLPSGTRVEAYIGDTLCGVASRRAGGFYVVAIVGPDSVKGCTLGATITFRVAGKPVAQTVVNDPSVEHRAALDLTQN